MPRARTSLLLVLTSCVAVSAFGAARITTTIGDRPCTDWIKSRSPSDRILGISLGDLSSRAWLSGFLTGANLSVDIDLDLLSSVDGDTAAAWVDKYCAEHATATVSDAAMALLEKLAAMERSKHPRPEKSAR
jgi:hypothetical protein